MAFAALLTACSAQGPTASQASVLAHAVAPTATPSVSSTPSVAEVVPPAITAPTTDGGVTPVAAPTNLGFAAGAPSSAASSHTTSGTPVLTGAVTYQSASFPRPYNCTESGTTYYKAPNIEAALDVTVLVTSASLANDLSIAAPNAAPRGLSNTSQLVSSAAVSKGVWRATYRTYVALYEPKYVPVSVSALEAADAGQQYMIAFPSPVTVTLANCRS